MRSRLMASVFLCMIATGFYAANAHAQTKFDIQAQAYTAVTLARAEAMGWEAKHSVSGNLQLTALGFNHPGTMLIGLYSKSPHSEDNDSIAENVDEAGNFMLKIPCLHGKWNDKPELDDSHHDGECPRPGGSEDPPAVTPEPTTMVLFGSGLVALGAALRRKTRAPA